MWILWIFVGIVIIGSGIAVYYLNKVDVPETFNMTLTINKDFGIERPDEWEVYTPNIDKTKGAMYLYAPKNTNVSDVYAEKILVSVAYFPEGNSPDIYDVLEDGMKSSQKRISDLRYASGPAETEINGLSGLSMELLGSINGKELKFENVIVKSPTRVYSLTHQCVASKCKYDDLFDQMIKSFVPNSG